MQIENQKAFKKTKRVFNVTLFFAIVFLVAYFAAFYLLKSSESRAVELSKEVASYNIADSKTAELHKGLAGADVKRATLASYFVDANDPVPFIETVEGYGKAMNTPVTFNSVEVKNNPNRLDVSIAAEGTFLNVYRFLDMLQNVPFEISISKAELVSTTPAGSVPFAANPKTNTNVWRAQVELSVLSVNGVK